MSAAAAKTVFVVDDDPSIRKSMARLLTSTGHRVDTFASAGDFLRRKRRPPGAACMILDLRMPDLDGLELQALLREANPTLPVVFATGHGEVPDSVRAMKLGAVDFLTKPVDETQLLTAVARALALDEARAQARGRADGAGAAAGAPDPARAPGLLAGGDRHVEQADRRASGRERAHDQGAPGARDAKDAGGLRGRAGADGRPARGGAARPARPIDLRSHVATGYGCVQLSVWSTPSEGARNHRPQPWGCQ